MPTYEYHCPECGPFSAFRPMAEYQSPQPCESCGVPAPRAALSVPFFAGMDAGRRTAMATNERSANAPTRSKGRHPAACGCCKPAAGRRVAESVSGAKAFPAARPWMLSH